MRVHRSGYHTDAELESELAWISALRNEDFRTPLVVPSADGRTMIRVSTPGVPEERQVDVVEWFDGSPLGESEGESLTDTDDVVATFTVIGELMAATHNHSERWERPSFFTRQAWDEDGILGPEPVWGPYEELDLLTDNHRELLEQARSKALDELAEFGKTPDRCGLIHGDFLPDNLLRSDETICLIDFDDAGFGWHLFDLTTLLFTHMDEEWYDDALGGLIEGYRSRRDLPDDHLARLPLFFVLRGFTYLSWMYTRRETETAQLITPFLVEGMADLLGDYLGRD